MELKKRTGKGSKETEAYIKQLDSQITSKERQDSDWNSKIEKTKSELTEWEQKRNEERARFATERARNEQMLKEDTKKLNQELSRNNEVRENIEEAISIKAELKKIELDLPTFKSIIVETAQKGRIGPYTAKKILEAIKKFGSLGKAIEVRINDEEARKRNILNLAAAEKREIDTLRGLDGQIAARLQTIEEYDKEIQDRKNELNSCLERVDKLSWQYEFFELFINMLSTSPSASTNLAAVSARLLELSQKGWCYPIEHTAEQRRTTFIMLIMGFYIYSIHCGKCGASFMVNKACTSYHEWQSSYYCPVCNQNDYTKADETFLNLMVSPELADKFRYVRTFMDITEGPKSVIMQKWFNLLFASPQEIHAALAGGRGLELKVADGTDKKQEL